MGRRQRAWDLEIFIIGDAYWNGRDDIIDICEKAGDHVLVHPYLGEKIVTIGECTLVEDDQEGGIARFTIPCRETARDSDAIFIVLDPDVRSASAFVLAQAQTDFVEVLADPPTFQADFIAGIRNVTKALRKAKARITTTLGVLDTLDHAIDDLDSTVASLLQTPSELAGKLIEVVVGTLSLVGQVTPATSQPGVSTPRPPAPRHEVLLGEAANTMNADTDAPPTPFVTDARSQQIREHAALTALVDSAAIAASAETAVGLEYESAKDAFVARDRLLELISTTNPASSLQYEAHETLGATSSNVFENVIAELPNIEIENLAASEPAKVIAYRLYRDSSRDHEIVGRNVSSARNPLAIVPFEDLEVLDR